MAENDDDLVSSTSVDTSLETPENATLEDEFAKLLNNFINQEAQSAASSAPKENDIAKQNPDTAENNTPADSLDSFVTEQPQTSTPAQDNLDSFISANPAESSPVENSNNASPAESLDSFVSPTAPSEAKTQASNSISTLAEPKVDEYEALKSEEQELARAISRFQDSITAMAYTKSLKAPTTNYDKSMLVPNYKPSIGKIIAQYLLSCWDLITKYDPENMRLLPSDAGDEDYITFAEGLNDIYLQSAIFSYLEILLHLETCEVVYEQKRELQIKNKIKKELYEEYMELQNRKTVLIAKLKEKNFPIDVDRLINNYFRAAQKDADGSFEALTKNPAMFAPIEMDKLKPKFFGLIKVSPEDGVKANQRIGAFIKRLKV